MKARSQMRPAWLATLLALAATMAMLLAMAGPPAAGAKAQDKPEQANCAQGRTIPTSKISIQLWTFSRYLGGSSFTGAPADAPTTGSTAAERLEYLLAYLSELGFRNIEPYSFHGLTAEQFNALADEYGLKVPSRHMSTNVATWEANLADASLLGQRYTGSGGFAAPGITTYENVLATAETLNQLGRASVQNGTGKIFGHNHRVEFTTQYVDPETGELKSAWQLLVENTDPRWVTFQLDVGWATVAGEDAVALVEEFGDRIELLHVKDAIVTVPGSGPEAVFEQTTIGQGDVDWASLFDAAQGDVKLYVIEMDPRADWDPFAFAADSFEYVDCLVF
jgi:sugar phosphate isomerase/epimerase